MLNLVVALATESRPVIQHFGLREDRSVTGFRVFRGEEVNLVVTGMGRVSCAAGVAALGATAAQDAPAAWLNIGIAGHARHAVGEGVHAVSILEAATGRSWYPAPVARLPGRGESLCTVDAPETEYTDNYVYDMEASAFVATALRYSSSELVQCYKIISDNREQGVDTVARHRIREAVADHLPRIEEMVGLLLHLAREVATARPRTAELEEIAKRWHFTVAQQHQLRDLLRRWQTLFGDRLVLDAELNRCPSAKSALAEIRRRLHEVYGGTEASAE